ncbi:MAG TPA: DUF3592 domain-containing protein [Bacteroidia bacterium]|nr:DUF3592 domain-containing protein [Bacteroidia bacterium]
MRGSSNFDVPRTLPGKVKAAVLLANPFLLSGVISLFVGIILFVVFVWDFDMAAFKFEGNEPIAQGIITKVQPTGSLENKRRIFSFHFRYATTGGKNFEGISYAPGTQGYNAGDMAPVEYLPEQPEKSRIRGMRMSAFGKWSLLVVLFPLIGIVQLIFAYLRGKKRIRLLQNGWLVFGKITGKERTNMKINNNRVYKFSFQFEANGATYTGITKTHKPGLLEDEAKERIIYDPNRPEKAMMVDALPRAVRRYFEGV